MGKIDDTDMKILAHLAKDANISVPKLSKIINVNSSVLYSRIKRLLKRNMIKRFTIEVDEEALGYLVTAIIGVNIDSTKRTAILEDLAALKEVRGISEVTGRFDLILAIKSKSLDELHRTVTEHVGGTAGVSHTETFVEMKKKEMDVQYSLLQR